MSNVDLNLIPVDETQLAISAGNETQLVLGAGDDAQLVVNAGDETQLVLSAGDNTQIVLSSVPVISNNGLMLVDGTNSDLALGNAGIPSLKFNGDANTGIFSPGADQVSISTGGTERLRVDGAGQIEAVSLGSAAAPTFSFTSDPNTGVYSPGADQLAISTAGMGRLFIDASGNVTARASDDSTGISLNPIGGLETWRSDGIPFIDFKSSSAEDFDCRIQQDTNGLRFLTGGNGASFERFRITSAGLVGIGTTSPQSVLHLRSDISGAATQLYLMNRTSGASVESRIAFTNSGNDLADNRHAYIGAITTGIGQNGNSFVIATNQDGSSAQTRVFVSSAGNVGIGTSSPGEKLHIQDSTTKGTIKLGLDYYGLIQQDGNNLNIVSNGDQEYRVGVGTNNGSGSIVFKTSTGAVSNTERVRIDSSGRLLVGTSSASNADATIIAQGNGQSSAFGARLYLARGESEPANLAGLGHLNFSDSSHLRSAMIAAVRDGGTWSASSKPGALTFSTTPDGASVPNERLRITSAGNVGIGTAAPSVILDVRQNQAAYSYFDFYNITAGGGIVWRQVVRNLADTGTTTIDLAKYTSGGFAIVNNDTGAANFTAFNVGASERLRITSAGNVGIGTTTPGVPLDVVGTAWLRHGSGDGGVLVLKGNTGTGAGCTIESSFVAGGYGPLNFVTGNSERLRITSAGLVGIGTSSPYSKLTVLPTSTPSTPATANQITIGEATANTGYRLQLGYLFDTGGRGSIQAYDNNSAATLILNGAGGNVGIGTTAPAYALDVSSGDIRLKRSAANNAALYFGATTNNYIYGDSDNNLFVFATNGSERARIDPNGKLLVGTSSSISEQFSGQARLQTAGTNYYGLASFQYSNDGIENVVSICKSRGASVGTHTVVQSNDNLGMIRFQGSDGTGFLMGASITASVDGTAVTNAGSFVVGRRYKILTVGDTNFTLIGASANTIGVIFAATGVGTGTGTATSEPYTNSMPGRLLFSTTADGASSPTERLRIDSAGQIEANSLGSAAAPTYSWLSDPDSGLYSPGANQLAISTGGLRRLFIQNNEFRFGAPDSNTVVFNIGNEATGDRAVYADLITDTTYTDFGLRLGREGGANSTSFLWHRGTGEFLFLTSEAAPIKFSTSNVERLRITSAGLVGIGTSSPGALLETSSAASGTLNGEVLLQRIRSNASNNVFVDIKSRRHTAGTTWEGVGMRLQHQVDATAMGFIEFNSLNAGQDIAIGTGGSTRLLINSTGNVGITGNLGIGTTTPLAILDVVTGTNRGYFDDSSGNLFRLNAVNAANSAYAPLTINGSVLTFQTGATERVRIDSSGRLLVGTSASTNFIGTAQPAFLQLKEDANNFALGLQRASNDNAPPNIAFRKTRATTDGGVTVVADGDTLGQIRFIGTDGTGAIQAATIRVDVDGNPGSTVMPGRLVFSTTSTTPGASPTERMRITSAGLVGIGTTAPGSELHIAGSDANTDILITEGSTNTDARIRNSNGVLLLDADVNNENGASAVVFGVDGNERVRIDSSGKLLVGTSTSIPGAFSDQGLLQVNGGTAAGYAGYRFTNDSGGAIAYFYKSRSATTGTNTIVQNGDICGSINFAGADGTTYHRAASITGDIDGTPGANDMPGRLVFSTTADGASSPTERMRIDSSGNVIARSSDDSTGITLNPIGGLELWRSDGAPFIDFKSSSAEDYDCRIQQDTNGLKFLTGGNSASFERLRISNAGTATLTAAASTTPLIVNIGASEVARITAAGRMGIGASSPGDLLEINSTTDDTGLYIRSRGANNRKAHIFFLTLNSIGGNTGATVFHDGNGLAFNTGTNTAAEVFRFDVSGARCYNQAAPAAVNATATLTVANLRTGIITSTSAAATDLTLPTGTDTQAGFGTTYDNFTFEWSVINTGPSLVRVLANTTTHLVTGSGSVATGTSGRFATRRTAANTFVTYRLT